MRRINLSAAIIVLICFFLPWVQVSCAGTQDALSGFGLARNDHGLLWLIPLLMFAVLVLGLLHARRERPKGLAILSACSGVVVTLLMNRERLRVQDGSNLIPAQLTGWFWLGLIAALVVTVTAVAMLLQRKRAP